MPIKGFAIVFLLCIILHFSLPASADTWSQTAFTDGSFSDTVTTTNAAEVTLKQNIDTGNGADGPLTISSPATFNPANTTSTVNTSSGSNSIQVTATAGFANSNEIIIINLKGTSANVGLYEFARINSIDGTTFNLNRSLTNTYDGAIDKIVIQCVPNYTNVTINAGGSLTCNAWDGTSGGVLVFRATGTVQVNVTDGINANSKGFAGGIGYTPGTPAGGGESYNGTGGSGGKFNTAGWDAQGGSGGGGALAGTSGYAGGTSPTAGSGGGGGGGAKTIANQYSCGAGGGGGGNGSPGSGGEGYNYGSDGSTITGGNGGAGHISSEADGGGGGGGANDGRTADGSGSSTLNTRTYLGGGGGAGGGANYNNGADIKAGGAGGIGGGIIFISATTVTVASGASINVKGGQGANGGWDVASAGGGGAGAGGSIIIFTNNFTNSGSITANGGAARTACVYNGGPGGGGRTYARYSSFTGNQPTPNYSGGNLSYLTIGTYVSSLINPSGLVSWGVLTYTKTVPANTAFTVDILKADNSVYASNVISGTDLSAIVPKYTPIKLRANFTSDNVQTPTLSDWGINYIGGGVTVTTTNWTDVIQGKAVAMGTAVAHVKFEMKTVEGTARWKRFRIDKGLKAYTNIACPDCKIEVQLWMENSNNGYWDINDTFISKGTFTNGVCWLNMNRWQITTTSKTYYIVYKLANDIGGGQRAGVKIADSSYLEFENATCVGVPP